MIGRLSFQIKGVIPQKVCFAPGARHEGKSRLPPAKKVDISVEVVRYKQAAEPDTTEQAAEPDTTEVSG